MGLWGVFAFGFTEGASFADTAASKTPVYIVPVKGEIDTAQFYIVRRALKEAAADHAAVILDMDTPGGALSTTLDIMEALENFKGLTLTYVNPQAASAGSFIASATQEIWFAPNGVMGAAEAVLSTGGDIPEAMQRKVKSFLGAKVRAISGESRYRAQVQRAMMDPDFVLEIDEKVLKPRGELLSLTAKEAMVQYGQPPEPLLGAGMADNMEALLKQRFGEGGYEIRPFSLTGAERIAVWLNMMAPLLLGGGLLLLFIEFKTPGFGLPGILGIALLGVYFAGNYLAGLAGYEPIILFVLGLVLLGIELYLVQGLLIPGITAVILIVGSVLWSGADIWPQNGEPFSWGVWMPPLRSLIIGVVIASGGAFLLVRFMPRKVYKGSLLVLEKSLAPEAMPQEKFPPKGSRGTVITALRPEGQVQIGEARYPARSRLEEIEAGAAVWVEDHDAFAVIMSRLPEG